jgi:DNA modification methylase
VPRALPKPYAELKRGSIRLRFFHGDSLDILTSLKSGSVDAIVTSPPYNLGIRYRS